MRCSYISDLHLESQDFAYRFSGGDVLVVAGDLCHARCLAPRARDRYGIEQRDRVQRFADKARAVFPHVLLVPGNHEPYDGNIEETPALLADRLPGFTVLDDRAVEIGGIWFFGTTLWTDFDGGSIDTMNRVRRRMGEFFFVKSTKPTQREPKPPRFQPEDAYALHLRARIALDAHLTATRGRTTVVVTHHAPSWKGLNPRHAGNGLDAAYASRLDDYVARLAGVPYWIHGHTHVRHRYVIGNTSVLANCRGFEGKDPSARAFRPDAFIEIH